MNILFLTTGRMESIEQHAIYPDLLRYFRDQGHNIYTVSAYEKRMGKKTEYIDDSGSYALHVKIGNLTKTNIIEKGISTLLIEYQFKRAIKQHLGSIKFDLIMYSTPPVTLSGVIAYVKHRDNAKTYLLLKDIFPQNAVDIGLMSKRGFKGILYKYFRNKEKKLYALSDCIGCMSPANVNYVIKNNPQVNPDIVEVCPNCVDIIDASVSTERRNDIRKKYEIPLDKKVFVYGGNLGKPQGIPFLIECLKKIECREDSFFLIVGSGTEYDKIQTYINKSNPNNVRLMQSLPKDDYDAMVGACDVGMIFLDYRFTIPNFPSRLLAYMQAKIPVLAVTDPNTDIGKTIVEGGFGWKCESNDAVEFADSITNIVNTSDIVIKEMKEKELNYIHKHYSVKNAYELIMKRMTV